MAYSQNDPRWKNTPLGFDSPDPHNPNYGTIGMYGCYVAAIANVCAWAGHDLTPAQVNDICKQNGWFIRGDLVSRDDVPAAIAGNLTFKGRTNWTDAVSMNFFADASDPNVAYIIKIDASPAQGVQEHFTMVWATHGGTDLEIDDGWDGVRKPLSHYGNPSVIIYSAMKFVKTATPPAPPPPIEIPVVPVPEPIPAVVPPPPYVPPAPPNKGTMAEKYHLKSTVMWFASANDAAFHMDAKGTLDEGDYYLWGKEGKSYNLSKDNMKDHHQWVNVEDNVIQAVVKDAPKVVDINPPKPHQLPSQVKTGTEDDSSWKSTYKPFYADGHADKYKTLQQIVIKDYGGKRGTDILPAGQELPIPGTFVKDGVTFYRPRSGRDEFFSWFYGIPLLDDNGVPNIVKATSMLDKIEMGFRDLPRIWIEDIKQIYANKKGKQ